MSVAGAPCAAQSDTPTPTPAPTPAPEAKNEAQPKPASPNQAPNQAPNEPPAPEDEAPLPSLDELLGLPEADGPVIDEEGLPPPDLGPEGAGADLERQLAGEATPEAFESAISMMSDTADRLQVTLDPGLTTQRMQEEILRKLDQVIASAEEQQQQQSSSSSSSSSSSQSNQPPQPQGGRPQDQAQAGDGDNRGEATPPGRRDGALNPELTGSRASWGALPARTREALLQGSGERFSAMYQSLTESYYRRLAEESER